MAWSPHIALVASALALGCTATSQDTPIGERPASPEPRVEIASIDWPSPAEIDRTALKHLPRGAREAVSESPVPALVPRDTKLLQSSVVTRGEHFFAFSSTDQDTNVNVAVHATRAAHRYDHVEPPVRGDRELRGIPGFVARNEGIWSASWMERGVAYEVNLECAPLEHPLCNDEKYLLELVEGLAFVGGQP